jgi:DNA-binding response OmpR family regulator
MKIAIIDDDQSYTAAIARDINTSEHSCRVFCNGMDFVRSLRHENWDVAIIDIDLPDMSGMEIITLLKGKLGYTVAIIVVTAMSDEIAAVKALDYGADDFVSKPVSSPVLLARINAVSRRGNGKQAKGPETFGEHIFHHGSQTVYLQGMPIQLTAKEFELALTFFRRMHEPLSRTYLLESVWGRNPALPSRTLDAHVSKVRQKLRLRPEHGFRLTPVYNHGYRLENVDRFDMYI